MIELRSTHSKYVISEEEYSNLMKFTREVSPEARRDRVMEYFKSPRTQEYILEIIQNIGALTAFTTITGTVIGGCGRPKGALIGLGTGFGAGLLGSFIYGGIELRQNYNRWIVSVEEKKVTINSKKFIKNMKSCQIL